MRKLLGYLRYPFDAVVSCYRKWRINRSLRILDAMDWRMRQAGWTRTQRRQFWRDFIKRQEVRSEVFCRLTQQ